VLSLAGKATGTYFASYCGDKEVTAGGFTFQPSAYFKTSPTPNRKWSTEAAIAGAGDFETIYQNECVDKKVDTKIPGGWVVRAQWVDVQREMRMPNPLAIAHLDHAYSLTGTAHLDQALQSTLCAAGLQGAP
jgi:hypothetical protein